MNSTSIVYVVLVVLYVWLACGFYHLGPFYLDGIYKEAFNKSFPTPFSNYRHWVFVPKMPVSWALIVPACLLCGPLARKAMKNFFGIEHNYFEED